jgi:acyl-CoA synthetase (NDP forming)
LFDEKRIARILSAAYERRDCILLETDGFEILKALGFKTCPARFVRNAQEARSADWNSFSGDKVVVKVVSPEILHKSDFGGVAIVANEREAIALTIEAMAESLCEKNLAGFTVNQFVTYDAALGGELLLGLRRTDDFGPVVTVGAGGVYTEFLAENFKPGRDVAILSCELTESVPGAVANESVPGAVATGSNTQQKIDTSLHGDDRVHSALSDVAITRLITNPPRGQKPRLRLDQIVAATNRLLWLGREFGHLISEFEINPLVIADGELIALDVLVKLGHAPEVSGAMRPVEKIKHLLEPRSAAVIGVSEKLNPGHVIVNNLLREGFDRTRLYIVKPGTESLEGCRCYSDIASLPERVDLLVVSVAAGQVPETVAQVIETRKAESIVVIPGGLEEKSGGELLASRMHAALAASREADWRGPVINGGNCLGIRSRPGRCDTMFIPQHKLSTSNGTGVPPVEKRAGCACHTSPVALISQSGAFGLAKADRLAGINPKYNITLGNQMDLTVGDYLTYLKDDVEVEVFAVYVEGFAPLDGVKFLKAAEEISARGKTVVLYRAGRTPAGAKASASHTASIAGDYAVTRALARHAGVVVAESLADFEDLTRLFAFLLGKKVAGRRLGAISNAGFECVAFADNLRNFTLPTFGERTTHRLRAVFERCRIDLVVDAHNPLDLTPMADDAAYEQAVRAVMADENVDVGIVGCVPMTPALNTLSRGECHHEDIDREDSVVQRLLRLNDEIAKPWVAVVDAGILYDPIAARLEGAGIPTFRTADRALRLFDIFCEAKTAAYPAGQMLLEPRDA